MHGSMRIAYAPAPGTKGFQVILRVLFGAFALLGLVFFLIGCFWLERERAFYASAEITQGEIVGFVLTDDGNRHPIVQYTVGSAVYEAEVNTYSSSMRNGDAMTLYYALDAPQAAKSKFYGGAIFMGVGGLFLLIGSIGLLLLIFRGYGKKQLRKNGEAVTARITAVKCAENVRVNGRIPYYVLCETGAVPALAGKPLKSGYFYTPLPQTLVGTAVRVYVHPNKPKRYFVDTETLQIPVQVAVSNAQRN